MFKGIFGTTKRVIGNEVICVKKLGGKHDECVYVWCRV